MNKTQLTASVVLALTATGSTFAYAQDVQTVPAPPSQASAVALRIEEVLTIGGTEAGSAADGSRAEADALGVGGKTLVEGTTGGSQNGPGEAHGALIGDGQGKPGDTGVEVAPWKVDVTESTADSQAALVKVFVGEVAHATVLGSRSSTRYTEDASTGTGSSDGVRLCLLGSCDTPAGDGLEVVVLHAETSSAGNGDSYVLGIDGTRILSQDDLADGDVCGLTLDGDALLFLEALCVGASGGPAGEGVTKVSSEASVVGLDLLDSLLELTVIGAAVNGAAVDRVASETPPRESAQAPVVSPAAPAAPASDGAEAAAALPPSGDAPAAGLLPRTGAAVAGILMMGLGLVGGGLGLRRFRRSA